MATAVSVSPRMNEATIAPRMSPTPPMMTMTSAFSVKMTPSEASKVRNMLSSAPPEALTAPPSAKANADVRATLMPTSPAADGLTETARKVRPARVWCSQR